MPWLWCNAAGCPGFYLVVNNACEPLNPAAVCCSARPVPDVRGAATAAGEDEAWLAAGNAGEQRAWQSLFDKWKRPLLAFFYRSLGSAPEAEDLTLEVFVRLHRAAPNYTPRAPFTTFLFHIARNLLLNELRRRRRKPAQALPPDAFDYFESDATPDARRVAELEEVFRRALVQLPEAQRTVLLLVHQQGFDHPAAAAALGVSENTLRVQLHRARQRLKEIMSSLQ